jgi:hypothetical protein
MEGVKTWLNSQAADFFGTGVQKLIPRYDMCFSLKEIIFKFYLKYKLR